MIDWIALLKTAAEIAAATTTIVGFGGKIYQWFEDLFAHSKDEHARRVWEDFKHDPEAHKAELIEVAGELRPNQDPVLEGYLLGLAVQKLRGDAIEIYSLLSGSRYTFGQVRDICMRLDPALEGLSTPYSKQDAAQWAVNLSMTRPSLRDDLVRNMVEINPDIVSEIILQG